VVFILELGGGDFIGTVKSLDALAQELDSLDDLGGGRAGGVEVHDFVLALEKDLSSVKRITISTRLGLQLDLVFFGLVLLLAKKSVSADGERSHFGSIYNLPLSVS